MKKVTLSPEHMKYLNVDEKTIICLMKIVNSRLPSKSGYLIARIKSVGSLLNNILKEGKLTDGENNDTIAMTKVGNSPLKMAKTLRECKYAGVNLFINTEKCDSWYCKDSENIDPIARDMTKEGKLKIFQKKNGYCAYHMTMRINPKFIEKVIQNIMNGKVVDSELENAILFTYREKIIDGYSDEQLIDHITDKLNIWFELHLQDIFMYMQSEIGSASHGNYKKIYPNIFDELIVNDYCETIKKKFAVLSVISNQWSFEHDVCKALINKTATVQQIQELAREHGSKDSDIYSLTSQYAEYLGVDINKFKKSSIKNVCKEYGVEFKSDYDRETAYIKILEDLTDLYDVQTKIKENFDKQLIDYARAIDLDYEKMASTPIDELITEYELDSEEYRQTRKSNDRLIIHIQILKQLTAFKQLSIIMRSDEKGDREVLGELLMWLRNMPINSKIAIKNFFKMLDKDGKVVNINEFIDSLNNINKLIDEEILKKRNGYKKVNDRDGDLNKLTDETASLIGRYRGAFCRANFFEISPDGSVSNLKRKTDSRLYKHMLQIESDIRNGGTYTDDSNAERN